jgi:hypothetical protein
MPQALHFFTCSLTHEFFSNSAKNKTLEHSNLTSCHYLRRLNVFKTESPQQRFCVFYSPRAKLVRYLGFCAE